MPSSGKICLICHKKKLLIGTLYQCCYHVCVLHSHEIVGTVQEVGSEVQSFKVGDHVGVGAYVNSCRDCEYCNDELEIHCSNGVVFTFNGLDVDGTVTRGGYSSFIVVHKRYV